MTQTVDLELQRNASLTQQFVVQDSTGGALDVSGASFSMKVRYAAGDTGTPLATATVTVVNAATGVIEIYLTGSSFSAVTGAHEIVRLAHDLIMTLSGKTLAIARGTLSLVPGVS